MLLNRDNTVPTAHSQTIQETGPDGYYSEPDSDQDQDPDPDHGPESKNFDNIEEAHWKQAYFPVTRPAFLSRLSQTSGSGRLFVAEHWWLYLHLQHHLHLKMQQDFSRLRVCRADMPCLDHRDNIPRWSFQLLEPMNAWCSGSLSRLWPQLLLQGPQQQEMMNRVRDWCTVEEAFPIREKETTVWCLIGSHRWWSCCGGVFARETGR